MANEDSDFSEEERLMKKHSLNTRQEQKNTLKLGEFHRNNISKKKRKASLKKQLRDAMRMAEHSKIPEQVKASKLEQAKTLKGQLRKQKEAIKFETRYKKIKFTGKPSSCVELCGVQKSGR